MLVTHTHLSALTSDQVQRLRTFVVGRNLPPDYFMFEGLYIRTNEVLSQKHIWENEAQKQRKMLLG